MTTVVLYCRSYLLVISPGPSGILTIPPLKLQMPEKPHVFIEVYILILIYGNVINYVRTVITCDCWLYALARLQS